MTLNKFISISLVWVESYCSSHGYTKTPMKVSAWSYTVLGGGTLWKHVQSLSWVSSTFAKAHFEKRNYDNSPNSLTISKQPFDWALATSKAFFIQLQGDSMSIHLFFSLSMGCFLTEGNTYFWGNLRLKLCRAPLSHTFTMTPQWKAKGSSVCIALLEASAWVSSVL